MSAIRHIHHINFIFRDLDAAIGQFQAVLDVGPFETSSLPERGVRTARVRIGETWLVLVAPTRDESVPGRYLAEHGEGFFLLSLGVANLDDCIAAMEQRLGSGAVGPKRQGLSDWQIADIDVRLSAGVQLQLAEDPDSLPNEAGFGVGD